MNWYFLEKEIKIMSKKEKMFKFILVIREMKSIFY